MTTTTTTTTPVEQDNNDNNTRVTKNSIPPPATATATSKPTNTTTTNTSSSGGGPTVSNPELTNPTTTTTPMMTAEERLVNNPKEIQVVGVSSREEEQQKQLQQSQVDQEQETKTIGSFTTTNNNNEEDATANQPASGITDADDDDNDDDDTMRATNETVVVANEDTNGKETELRLKSLDVDGEMTQDNPSLLQSPSSLSSLDVSKTQQQQQRQPESDSKKMTPCANNKDGELIASDVSKRKQQQQEQPESESKKIIPCSNNKDGGLIVATDKSVIKDNTVEEMVNKCRKLSKMDEDMASNGDPPQPQPPSTLTSVSNEVSKKQHQQQQQLESKSKNKVPCINNDARTNNNTIMERHANGESSKPYETVECLKGSRMNGQIAKDHSPSLSPSDASKRQHHQPESETKQMITSAIDDGETNTMLKRLAKETRAVLSHKPSKRSKLSGRAWKRPHGKSPSPPTSNARKKLHKRTKINSHLIAKRAVADENKNSKHVDELLSTIPRKRRRQPPHTTTTTNKNSPSRPNRNAPLSTQKNRNLKSNPDSTPDSIRNPDPNPDDSDQNSDTDCSSSASTSTAVQLFGDVLNNPTSFPSGRSKRRIKQVQRYSPSNAPSASSARRRMEEEGGVGSGFLCPRCHEHMSYDHKEGCERCGLMCYYAPGEGVIITVGRDEVCPNRGIVGDELSKGMVNSMVDLMAANEKKRQSKGNGKLKVNESTLSIREEVCLRRGIFGDKLPKRKADSMVANERKRQSKGDGKLKANGSTLLISESGKKIGVDNNEDVEMMPDDSVNVSPTTQTIPSTSLEPRRSLRKSQPPSNAFPMLSEYGHHNSRAVENDVRSSSNDISSAHTPNNCDGDVDDHFGAKVSKQRIQLSPQRREGDGMSKQFVASASSLSNDIKSVIVIIEGQRYSEEHLVSAPPQVDYDDTLLIPAHVDEYKEQSMSQGHENEPMLDTTTITQPLDIPNPLPPLPTTSHCTWTYDEPSRVLLAKFHSGSSTIDPIDEVFLLKMMEWDDITVVSEGLVNGFDSNLWNLDYIDRCVGESYYHKIRVFHKVDAHDIGDDDDDGEDRNDEDEDDYQEMWGQKDVSRETKMCKTNPVTHKEQNGFQSMKIRDYISYLKRRQAVLLQSDVKDPDVYDADMGMNTDVDVIDPMFHFTPFDGSEKAIHVVNSVLYLIDFDLMKLLPALYENMTKSFRLPGLLPGGIHCMMNLVPTSARPFMGPNLYMTPPGSFTHFHQDGHGTVDSGHQCLAGYNEVVMLRRMSNDRKHHSLEILNGNLGRDDERSYDALYGLPHGDANGEKPPWPSSDAIEECRRMNYCPSVFILKPGQFVHINKGRIHAFRKMATASLPASDCHSHLRKALIKEENITGEVVCLSIAWDWMYRGYTIDGMNNELESALLCAKLNQKHKKLSLAITETSILHSALVAVSQFEQSRSEDKRKVENIIPLAFCTSPLVQNVPSPLTILKGIQPSLKRILEGHEEALVNAERCRTKGAKQQTTIFTTPNAYQNPDLFDLDAYGDGFFCKLCNHELSNTYMHCDGCEELLKEDFNICTDCHSKEKYKIFHQMCPDNSERDAFLNHTGDMSTVVMDPPCQCPIIPNCKKCSFCSGCKCTCHTSFTLNFRFMSIGEEEDLVYRVNAAVTQSSVTDDKAGLVPARSRYCSRSIKDPNAPEINVCAFIIYKNTMQKQRQSENSGKLIKYTLKSYNNLTAEEKTKWENMALKDKARFDNQMKRYIPPHGYDAHGYFMFGGSLERYYEPAKNQPRIKGDKHVKKVKKFKKGTKHLKDPNAPKRPKHPRELYQIAMSNYISNMTRNDKNRYLSQMYDRLSKEEQMPWETRAQEGRARYNVLQEAYAPSEGYDSQGQRLEDYDQWDEPTMKRPRTHCDVPCFPRNDFTFFAIEMRPVIMDKYPDKDMNDVINKINERWNDTRLENRKRYIDMQMNDVKRFEKEMQKYNAQNLEKSSKPRVKTKGVSSNKKHPAKDYSSVEAQDFVTSVELPMSVVSPSEASDAANLI